MRAVAILGPNATLEDVRRFDIPGVQVEPLSAGNPLAGADAALVFGGDGTVHDHLAGFVSTQVPMLPVPLGSGNDFHRAVGIRDLETAQRVWKTFSFIHTKMAEDVTKAAETWRLLTGGNATSRGIDLGLISRADGKFVSHFCCVAGVGLDSEANRRANAMPRWLRANGGYIAAVFGAVAAYKPQRITIESSPSLSEPAMFVAFANAPSYGSGMRIAPKARLDDGLLDVCFVRKVGKPRLLRLFPTVFSGKHLGIPEVEYFQADRLRIETETPLDVYADGEFICQTPIEVTVAPRAMRVITSVAPAPLPRSATSASGSR